ncbi:MAG: hypothetical protein IT445_18730 [Phycisphaeraceae bacterium]|nr:hypothetical protein [Phycisphaeraceae bacterium]
MDGFWSFSYLGDIDPDSVRLESIAFQEWMPVPGCFDATPRYAGCRGIAAYRTKVRLHPCGRRVLQLGSVHHWGSVYFNKQHAGTCSGGFVQQNFILDKDARGIGEIIVLVDNRIDPRRSPLHLDNCDWYHYGGIARSVCLVEAPEVSIDAVRIHTQNIHVPTITVSVSVVGISSKPIVLQIEVDGNTVHKESILLSGTLSTIERSIDVPGLSTWSSDSPNIHAARVTVDDDELIESFGIRSVAVVDQQLLVNGCPVQLLGVNRHESSIQFGHTQTDSLLIEDLHRLDQLGCNFVRTSHYPPDPRFLTLCDKLGIYVWAETTSWQQNGEQLSNQHYLNAQLDCADSLVAACYNHPSVILLGALNEVASHDVLCRTPIELVLNRLRSSDPTRPVTFACNHPSTCLALPMVDVIAINVYPGWYDGEIEEIPTELDRAIANAEQRAGRKLPVIISEIGAGAIPGWRDSHNGRWSERYQSNLLDKVIRHLFLVRNDCTGLAIWQFCDIRTTESPKIQLSRPRGLNNKGLLDEYRRPKEAFGVVAEWYQYLSGKVKQPPLLKL